MTNFDVETERQINVFRIQERYISAMKWSKDRDGNNMCYSFYKEEALSIIKELEELIK